MERQDDDESIWLHDEDGEDGGDRRRGRSGGSTTATVVEGLQYQDADIEEAVGVDQDAAKTKAAAVRTDTHCRRQKTMAEVAAGDGFELRIRRHTTTSAPKVRA